MQVATATEGPGFYFESSEEFDKKYKENLNKGDSGPNEEYFIEFIDGDSFEQPAPSLKVYK